jgi:hypothetical protein
LAAIDPVWMRDERCRIVRRRLARRELLVRVCSRAKNEISGVLAPCRTCTGRRQITFSPGWRRPEPQRAASTSTPATPSNPIRDGHPVAAKLFVTVVWG